jgi:hypothetical protein
MNRDLFIRALLIWLLIALIETIHGVIRQLFLVPVWGDLPSRQVGVIVGSILILLVAWLSYGWIRARTMKQQLAVGALWVALMIGFETGLAALLGISGERVRSDYNIFEGGYMALGLIVLLLSLVIVSKLKSRDP